MAHSIQGDVLFKGVVARSEGITPAGGRVSFDAPSGSVRVQTVTENVRRPALTATPSSSRSRRSGART